jgi:hypothetical protein
MAKAWSWSVINDFETCEWRYYLTKVTKEVVEPQSEEMRWGNQVHKALEHRIKDNVPLPGNMVQYNQIMDRLFAATRKPGVIFYAEQKLALSLAYQPRRFFDKDVWVRAITDLTIVNGDTAAVIDYKTGKPKPQSAQLKLTAAVTFHTYPQIQTIHNSFLWLNGGSTPNETFHREDVPKLWQEFAPRVQRLEEAHQQNKFPKKPSGLCNKWCPVPHKLCEYRGGR